jgi:hypothetical protein
MQGLEQLPGTQWCRYALPLEYPPSRDMRARWGYSRPLIPQLLLLFEGYADSYRTVIADMRRYGAELRDVPHTFDAAKLPMPGWMGTAINPIDCLALYAFIRRSRPATFLEIGSGTTTCFAHLAPSARRTCHADNFNRSRAARRSARLIASFASLASISQISRAALPTIRHPPAR